MSDQTTKSVLIVDDDPEVLQLMSTVLSREGFAVQTAKDGFDGILELGLTRFSVIILDLMMPKFDGFGVINYLEKHHRALLKRVIVVSAIASDETRQQLRRTGVFRIFQKPFQIAELAAAVKECSQSLNASVR